MYQQVIVSIAVKKRVCNMIDLTEVEVTQELKKFTGELLGAEGKYTKGLDYTTQMLRVVLETSVPEMSNHEFSILQKSLIVDLLKRDEKIKRPFIDVFKSVMKKGDLHNRLTSAPMWFVSEVSEWSNIQQAAALYNALRHFNGFPSQL